MTRPAPAGPPTVARHNRGLVLAALRTAGSASRAQLAEATGLTRATVAALLEPLLAAAVLAEDAATPRGVGRPSRAVRFHDGGPVAVGVAVDVDTLAVCAVGVDGTVRAQRRVVRDHRRLAPAAVLDGAATLVTQVRADVAGRVLGIGLALPAMLGPGRNSPPGPVPRPASALALGAGLGSATAGSNLGSASRSGLGSTTGSGSGAASGGTFGSGSGSASGGTSGSGSGAAFASASSDAAADRVVLRAPNLPGLVGSRPGAALADLLGVPVTVGNEATLGALAHLDLAPDLVYVSAGIGIGGGIVLDGRIYPGSHGLAGEVGHVVVDSDGPECGCGGRGCVEQYAGTPALLADAGVDDLTTLEAGLAHGDEQARAATTRAARALGVGLASVLNVLDVPVVVLGGTYARLGPRVLPTLRAELADRALSPTPVRVLTSDRGDAAVRGAAEFVLDAVARNPDRLLT